MKYEQLPLFDAPTSGAYAEWPRPAVVSERPPVLRGAAKRKAITDHLVDRGVLPVQCAACRVWGHTSATCPSRSPTGAAARAQEAVR